MVARIIHFASVAMMACLMSFLLFVAEPVFRGRAARSPQELGRLGQVLRHLIRLGWAMLGLSVVSGAAWLVLAFRLRAFHPAVEALDKKLSPASL